MFKAGKCLQLMAQLSRRTEGHIMRAGCRSYTADPSNPLNRDAFDEKMLDILVCPLSKSPLRFNKDSNELISDEIRVAYPIVNGIPNLIPQDARQLDEKSLPDL